MQSQDSDYEIFNEAFEGMFTSVAQEPEMLQSRVSDPGPPVPLDSNVWVLLFFGLLVGLKYYYKSISKRDLIR